MLLPFLLAAGAYNVGVGQTYTTLTEAVADINHRGISGAVILNLTDASYTDKTAGGAETFPIVFGTITGSSATNTITITGNGMTYVMQVRLRVHGVMVVLQVPCLV